jgi:hypothetical protein
MSRNQEAPPSSNQAKGNRVSQGHSARRSYAVVATDHVEGRGACGPDSGKQSWMEFLLGLDSKD